jgi:hypothetical protein
LGKGSFGTVRLARKNETLEKFVIIDIIYSFIKGYKRVQKVNFERLKRLLKEFLNRRND